MGRRGGDAALHCSHSLPRAGPDVFDAALTKKLYATSFYWRVCRCSACFVHLYTPTLKAEPTVCGKNPLLCVLFSILKNIETKQKKRNYTGGKNFLKKETSGFLLTFANTDVIDDLRAARGIKTDKYGRSSAQDIPVSVL